MLYAFPMESGQEALADEFLEFSFHDRPGNPHRFIYYGKDHLLAYHVVLAFEHAV